MLIVNEAGGKTNDINIERTTNINLRASSEIIYEKMLEKLSKF